MIYYATPELLREVLQNHAVSRYGRGWREGRGREKERGGEGTGRESRRCLEEGVDQTFIDVEGKWWKAPNDTAALANCCANCVDTSRPQQWGPDLPFLGQAIHSTAPHKSGGGERNEWGEREVEREGVVEGAGVEEA